MKTMAEVILETMRDHRVLWEIGLDDDVDLIAKCQSCGYLSTELETWEHQSNVAAEILAAAGYGPVKAVAVVHVAHDTEAHARSFNEGYETAMAQELADDPTTAQDWLDAKLANAKAEGWDECEVAPYEIRLEPGGKFWQPYKDNPYRGTP